MSTPLLYVSNPATVRTTTTPVVDTVSIPTVTATDVTVTGTLDATTVDSTTVDTDTVDANTVNASVITLTTFNPTPVVVGGTFELESTNKYVDDADYNADAFSVLEQSESKTLYFDVAFGDSGLVTYDATYAGAGKKPLIAGTPNKFQYTGTMATWMLVLETVIYHCPETNLGDDTAQLQIVLISGLTVLAQSRQKCEYFAASNAQTGRQLTCTAIFRSASFEVVCSASKQDALATSTRGITLGKFGHFNVSLKYFNDGGSATQRRFYLIKVGE